MSLSKKLEEKELEILRKAIDAADKRQGEKIATSPLIKNIIKIVELFLKTKQLICYGGTAINNILPKSAQFYNRDIDIPDYDFFSTNAMEDAIQLANVYYKAGFAEVEAKAKAEPQEVANAKAKTTTKAKAKAKAEASAN